MKQYEVVVEWEEAGRFGTQTEFVGVIMGESAADAVKDLTVKLYAINEPQVGDGETKLYELKFDGVKARN